MERLLELRQHFRIRAGLIVSTMLHRKCVNHQVLTTGQFHTGRHNPWVFAVADQQVITLLEGEAPERQNTTAGDVFA